MDWLRRVEHVCRRDLADRELRDRLLGLVQEQIAFDGHVFALTDPVTRVSTSPHAHLPGLEWSRLPELVRWRYLTTATRVDRIAGGPAVSMLGTGGGEASPAWLHVLSGLGVADSAVVAFADRYGVWGYLELTRGSAFTSTELDLLSELPVLVAPALRAAVARTFLDPADQLLPIGPAVIVLGSDLTVRSQTEAAAAALLQLLPPDEPMAPIPAAAYNIGAALVADEAGIGIGEPWARVHLGGSRWVTVKASRLGDDIAVSIEPATPAERTDLYGRASGLSARETEILDHLVSGRDSKAIAGDLVLSEHTVNDHVKAVLAKTGARTRQLVVSRALGAG